MFTSVNYTLLLYSSLSQSIYEPPSENTFEVTLRKQRTVALTKPTGIILATHIFHY